MNPEPGFYIQIALCVVSLYLFITQVLHRYRFKGLHGSGIHKERYVAILLIVSSASILIAGALQTIMAKFVDVHLSVTGMDIFYTFTMIFYAISLLFMYSILWLRQRVIYTSPALTQLTNKTSRFVSKYLLMYLVIVAPVEAIVLGITYSTDFCNAECFDAMFYTFTILGPVIAQMLLLLLLLHLLMKHHRTNVLSDTIYVALMRRIILVTTVCMISDVVSVLLDMNVVEYIPLQANLVVNLICVILPTTDWKSRLFPCAAPLHDIHSSPLKPSPVTSLATQSLEHGTIQQEQPH